MDNKGKRGATKPESKRLPPAMKSAPRAAALQRDSDDLILALVREDPNDEWIVEPQNAMAPAPGTGVSVSVSGMKASGPTSPTSSPGQSWRRDEFDSDATFRSISDGSFAPKGFTGEDTYGEEDDDEEGDGFRRRKNDQNDDNDTFHSNAELNRTGSQGSGDGSGAGLGSAAARGRNAAACRKQRQKRKAAEENLRKHVADLEANRDLYLRRIADLQFEVDTMRMAGTVDLRKENELLRIEIRKHKMHIVEMVKTVSKYPDMYLEERVRILKNVVDSALSQIVGIVHTSSRWDPLYTVKNESSGLEMRVFYELLPRHLPMDQAKRVNFRCEMLNVQRDPASLHFLMSSFWSQEANLKNVHSSMPNEERATWSMLELDSPGLQEAKNILGENNIRLSDCEEVRDGALLQKVTFFSCQGTRGLVPHAFLAHGYDEESHNNALDSVDSGMVDCLLHANTTCDQELANSNIATNATTLTRYIHGHAVIPSNYKQDLSHIISVFSIPFGEYANLTSVQDLLTKDHKLTPGYGQSFQIQLDLMAQAITSGVVPHDQSDELVAATTPPPLAEDK